MTPPSDPTLDPRKRLEKLLDRGEVVRWSGGPDPAPSATASRRRIIRLLYGFGVLALLIDAVVAVLKLRTSEALDGSLLVIAGVGFLALAYGFLLAARDKAKQVRASGRFFAITDRRVIAVDGSSALVIAPQDLRGVMEVAGEDRRGDVHVFYRAEGRRADAEDESVLFADVIGFERAQAEIELLARRHGVDISDEAA
jgi:hypothetical protein